VRLAGAAAAIQHLVVDRLECGRYAGVHERVAQAFCLAGLSPLGDEVERAVDRS
jgi:tRNA G37 N-methylase TrmD